MTDALRLLYDAERVRLSGLSTQNNGDYLNPVFGEGPLTPHLMLIGEARGRKLRLGIRSLERRAGSLTSCLSLRA